MRQKAAKRMGNRIGLIHASIAEFLLTHTRDEYTCIAYDLSECGSDIVIHILDRDLNVWRDMSLRTWVHEIYTIDIAGRGIMIRDVMFLLSVIGMLKITDYVPLRYPDREYLHVAERHEIP